jgi:polyketide synthase 5
MTPPTPAAQTSLGVELLGVVVRLNRLATQRTRLPLPGAEAHLLSTIEDQGSARILAEGADTAIAPDEGAYAFEALLRHDRAYTGYAPIMGTPWLTAFAERRPFAEAFRSIGQNSTGTSKLRAELDELPPDEWPTRLQHLISEQVSLILRRIIDPDRPLSEYGMDSLGALELRTRIETETGIRIPPTGITTIRGLAELLCEKLAPTEAARPRRVGLA